MMNSSSSLRSYCLALVTLFLALASASAVDIVAHRGASADAPENTLPAFNWLGNVVPT